MNRKDRIYKKLINNIECGTLDVVNNSHLHKGHMGDDGTLETHYKIVIKSLGGQFTSCSRVEVHRVINNLLQDEFNSGLHALEISVSR
jgi:BolA family transcriptional regulator, general stress-responsive regulator